MLYSADKSTLIKCPSSTKIALYDNMPNTVKAINDSAFANTKVQSIFIPASVEKIGADVFKNGKLAIIKGITGSYAEKYTAENNFSFTASEAPATTPAATTVSGVPTTTTATDSDSKPATTTTSGAPATTTAAGSASKPVTTTASGTPASTTASPSTTAKMGDVNGDGKLTTSDARMILQNAVGLIDFNENQKKNADVNKDGKISTSDASRVLRFVVGVIDEL